MNKKILLLVICLISVIVLDVYAGQVHFKNGDKITAEIIDESDRFIKIETEPMGVVVVDKSYVDKVMRNDPEKAEVDKKTDELWQREFSLGYDKTTGNTKNSHLFSRLFLNRKTGHDEFTVKGDTYYSSADKKMDSQKWRGLLRYAFSFGAGKWYNFYKVEGDHDRFANIDYRLVPAAGVGYWFSDKDYWKAMLECGAGFEHTVYKDDSEDSGKAVLIPRGFLEKTFFDKFKLSQEVVVYPSLERKGEYRLHAETALANNFSDELSLKFSLMEDYNSQPKGNAKKTDSCFITSLSYSF